LRSRIVVDRLRTGVVIAFLCPRSCVGRQAEGQLAVGLCSGLIWRGDSKHRCSVWCWRRCRCACACGRGWRLLLAVGLPVRRASSQIDIVLRCRERFSLSELLSEEAQLALAPDVAVVVGEGAAAEGDVAEHAGAWEFERVCSWRGGPLHRAAGRTCMRSGVRTQHGALEWGGAEGIQFVVGSFGLAALVVLLSLAQHALVARRQRAATR
jgi:hypothetical protein